MLRLGMALLLCALVGIVGCGSSSSTTGGGEKKAPTLVGTWEASDPGIKGITLVMTFTADGKFTRETVMEGLPKEPNVKVDGGKQEGSYKQEDKTLTLSTPGKDTKMTIKELTDSKLVLANAESKEVSFTKKK